MPPRKTPDPATVRAQLRRIQPWVEQATARRRHQADETHDGARGAANGTVPQELRQDVAAAVRGTLALLAAELPGHAVEVRVPPFAAVQCVAGPRHTRGTPPNVVETDPATWLALAGATSSWEEVAESGFLQLSGVRAAEIRAALPVVRQAPIADA